MDNFNFIKSLIGQRSAEQTSSQIRVIGPRGSGKTTYLTGLAYWPQRQSRSHKFSSFEVKAMDDNTKSLKEDAENILLERGKLAPTNPNERPPLYNFNIKIKHFLKKSDDITLSAQDYSGEIFDDLAQGSLKPEYEKFLKECFDKEVAGCLILLSDWTKEQDRHYSRGLERFIERMEDRIHDLRLAVAMSKCERGELWSGRLDPEFDIFEQHLPRTKQTLQTNIPAKNLHFYAISTFGVLKRNDPRPNRQDSRDKKGFVLREPNRWRPYNMIEPLYWLSKGKRLGF
jgi:hypothetical protein